MATSPHHFVGFSPAPTSPGPHPAPWFYPPRGRWIWVPDAPEPYQLPSAPAYPYILEPTITICPSVESSSAGTVRIS